METTSEPGRVQLSASAAGALERLGCSDLGLESRGERSIKGKASALTVALSTAFFVFVAGSRVGRRRLLSWRVFGARGANQSPDDVFVWISVFPSPLLSLHSGLSSW